MRRFAGASALIAGANALFRRDRGEHGRGLAGVDVPLLEFDATATLHTHLREAGLGDDRADAAATAVRAAVRRLPGAGWINVEHVVGPWSDGWAWMRRAEWVTVHRRWSAVPPEGGGVGPPARGCRGDG